MTSGKTSREYEAGGGNAPAHKRKAKPEWADGLRQIYDSVLDEPLPDSFNDLLAKLDDPS